MTEPPGTDRERSDEHALRAIRWHTVYMGGGTGLPDAELVRALRWHAVYHSASAARPRNRLARVLRRDGDLLTNSGSLMGTTVVTAAFGFVYWWVAAREFSPAAVGSASAAVSAMTLIGTLGMFGMGTMLIAELPRMTRDKWRLITSCMVTAGLAAMAGALIYVALAGFAVPSLRDAVPSVLMAILLVAGISLNGATLVLDEGLIGLLSGPLQLVRNLYFAVGKLVLLTVLAVLPLSVSGGGILASWVGGIVLSVALLAVSLRRRGMWGPMRPGLEFIRTRIGQAFTHNMLNMALFLPRTTLPLVVTAVLSTRATAGFYTAWMVFTFIVMIPSNLATTLFAVAAGDRVAMRSKVRTALAVSLLLGIPASAVLAFGAEPIMSVFGAEYARTASGALAVLAFCYVPTVFRQLFVGVVRVLGRVRSATVLAVGSGVLELAAAGYGGSRGDLTTMTRWLAGVFVAEALVMAPVVLRTALAPVRRPDPVARPHADRAAPSAGVSPAGDQDQTVVMPRLGDPPPVSPAVTADGPTRWDR